MDEKLYDDFIARYRADHGIDVTLQAQRMAVERAVRLLRRMSIALAISICLNFGLAVGLLITL